MSALANTKEEVVELGPEHRIIFDLISGIKKETTDNLRIIHADIKRISTQLDSHLGYHKGVEMKEEEKKVRSKSSAVEIVQAVVSLFKEQPLILVVIAAMVLLTSVDTLHAIHDLLPW